VKFREYSGYCRNICRDFLQYSRLYARVWRNVAGLVFSSILFHVAVVFRGGGGPIPRRGGVVGVWSALCGVRGGSEGSEGTLSGLARLPLARLKTLFSL
jgi:hypothetical protein